MLYTAIECKVLDAAIKLDYLFINLEKVGNPFFSPFIFFNFFYFKCSFREGLVGVKFD